MFIRLWAQPCSFLPSIASVDHEFPPMEHRDSNSTPYFYPKIDLLMPELLTRKWAVPRRRMASHISLSTAGMLSTHSRHNIHIDFFQEILLLNFTTNKIILTVSLCFGVGCSCH